MRKDLRRQGIGSKLWKAIVASCGDRNISLDGVSAMVPWYTKQGFVWKGHSIQQHSVRVSQAMKIGKQYPLLKVPPVSDGLWPPVMDYDRQVYPDVDRCTRERILRAFFTQAGVHAVVAMEGEIVVGYGSVHRKDIQDKFGIRFLHADNTDVVDVILNTLLKDVPVGLTLYFWSIVGKTLPTYLNVESGKTVEPFHRMYTKSQLDINVSKIWLTSAHIV